MYDHYKKKCLSFLRLQKYPDTDTHSHVIPKIFYYSADIEHLTKIGKKLSPLFEFSQQIYNRK